MNQKNVFVPSKWSLYRKRNLCAIPCKHFEFSKGFKAFCNGATKAKWVLPLEQVSLLWQLVAIRNTYGRWSKCKRHDVWNFLKKLLSSIEVPKGNCSGWSSYQHMMHIGMKWKSATVAAVAVVAVGLLQCHFLDATFRIFLESQFWRRRPVILSAVWSSRTPWPPSRTP